MALNGWLDRRHWPWWLLALGLVAMYATTVHGLATTIWTSDEQGHGPIVLAVSIWMLFKQWPEINRTDGSVPRLGWGWAFFALAVLMFMFGKSQRILSAQTLSVVIMLIGLLLLMRGPRQLKAAWFPLFFLLFLVPLPAALVDAVTQPMKMAVSTVAAQVMYWAGYPIARSGVILQIGPYQLLVADACAGLHTLFTLEAMGLLYLNVVRHASLLRNVSLAILIVPISFIANVIRVIALSLITFHFGDAAGQGFLHGFAGMVLFLSALILIIAADSLLRTVGPSQPKTA